MAAASYGLSAQEQVLNLDPARSEVHFAIEDPLHAVHGTFRMESGKIVFNTKDHHITGVISVDATSGESGNSARDRKMAKEELKGSSFHSVTFAPLQYSGDLAAAGESGITVAGSFTLLGTPHQISVPMQVTADASQYRATGRFVIPYVEWGLRDPSNFLLHVSKQVTIDLVMVGTVTPGRSN